MTFAARKRNVVKNIRKRVIIARNVLKSEKVFRILFFFTVVSTRLLSFGQEQSLSVHSGFNRMDYFSGVQYSFSKTRWETSASIDIGTGRTFGQWRLFPRFSIQEGYVVQLGEKSRVAPLISYSYSLLRVNRINDSFHHWHELLGGGSYSYGQKWRILVQAKGGLLAEHFRSTLSGKYRLFNAIGYETMLGIQYKL